MYIKLARCIGECDLYFRQTNLIVYDGHKHISVEVTEHMELDRLRICILN